MSIPVEFQAQRSLCAVPFQSRLSHGSDRFPRRRGKTWARNMAAAPSGTGPVQIRMSGCRNQRCRRNSVIREYWDGAAKASGRGLPPITDANTRVAEMMAGGIDVMVEVRRTISLP